MTVYYRKDGKIVGKFNGCDTQSKFFKEQCERFESNEDLPLEVTPTPTPIEYPSELKLQSQDGTTWKIKVDNTGKLSTSKLT